MGVPAKKLALLADLAKKWCEAEGEEEKNVGIFSVNSSFFLARKKCNHHNNLPFYLIRSRLDPVPVEIPGLLTKQKIQSRNGNNKLIAPVFFARNKIENSEKCTRKGA